MNYTYVYINYGYQVYILSLIHILTSGLERGRYGRGGGEERGGYWNTYLRLVMYGEKLAWRERMGGWVWIKLNNFKSWTSPYTRRLKLLSSTARYLKFHYSRINIMHRLSKWNKHLDPIPFSPCTPLEPNLTIFLSPPVPPLNQT